MPKKGMRKDGFVRDRDPSKRHICDAVATIRISGAYYLLENNFVRFTIHPYSTKGRRNGVKLLIYDHRPTVVAAAEKAAPLPGDRYRIESLQGAALRRELEKVRTVAQVVNDTPAKVEVMERRRGSDFSYYVNLFHAQGAKPTALFSESLYPGKFFEVENGSLWSWGTKKSPKNSRDQVTLVALTNEERRAVIKNVPNRHSHAIVGITIRTERRGETFGGDEMVISGNAP